MSESTPETLESQLKTLIGTECSPHPAQDVNAALQVAEQLKSKGFSFSLKDMCPKSLCETQWRAVFQKGDEEFMAENTRSEIAICAAAVKALIN